MAPSWSTMDKSLADSASPRRVQRGFFVPCGFLVRNHVKSEGRDQSLCDGRVAAANHPCHLAISKSGESCISDAFGSMQNVQLLSTATRPSPEALGRATRCLGSTLAQESSSPTRQARGGLLCTLEYGPLLHKFTVELLSHALGAAGGAGRFFPAQGRTENLEQGLAADGKFDVRAILVGADAEGARIG